MGDKKTAENGRNQKNFRVNNALPLIDQRQNKKKYLGLVRKMDDCGKVD